MENKSKGFGLSSWSVTNRKTVFLIGIIIILAGLGAYSSMPKEQFPEIAIPEIYIGVAKPGSSPEYMSKKIVEAIETELAGMKLVDEINSNAVHGYATIRVKFDFKMPVDEGLQKVKDAIDKARTKTDFPDLPIEPNIFEMDPSKLPILNVNLRGADPVKLKRIAEELEDRIEDLAEINEVDLRGVQTQEMRIEVDPIRAQAVNVSLDDIQNAVASENQTIPGGEILMDGMRKTIRIEGEFKNADELKQIVVKQDDYLPVHLEDIAEVFFGNGDTTSYAREFGNTVVMLDVKKQSGKNLLDASDKIKEILAEAHKDGTIPSNVIVSITNDQSNQTRDMVSNLENSIYMGILLVVGVLMFFLGLRNALFVGIAIPLSMLMSFLILNTAGVTLNVMVLFSLVLALGMLVDNGIVIVENIYRNLSDGLPIIQAVKAGVGEVAWPIISSTATTVAAFIPLAIWPGIMGEFMKYLPITLIVVLGSSLFVALVINPVLAVSFMKLEEKVSTNKKTNRMAIILGSVGIIFLILQVFVLGNLLIIIAIFTLLNHYIFKPAATKFQNNALPKMEARYGRFLTYAVAGKNPRKFLFGTIGLFVVSIFLMIVFPPKVIFMPDGEPNYINVFVSYPIGTDIKVVNETTLKLESEINKILDPYLKDTVGIPKEEQLIQSIISQVGDGTSDPAQGVSNGNTPNKARLTVNFVESQFRKGFATSIIMKKIQEKTRNMFTAEVEVSVAKDQNGPPTGAPINIELSGRGDYKDLILQANDLKTYLDRKQIKGVEKLKLDVDASRQEIPIRVNRNQIRKLNSSTMQVGQAIRKALLGQDISTYTLNDETYDIVVRFNQKNRESLDALLDQELIFRNNEGKLLNIPIRSVIEDPKESVSFSAVIRKDQVPVVSVLSNVVEGFNANEVVAAVKKTIDQYIKADKLDPKFTYKFGGEQEEQAKEMAFLSKALLIAVFMILLIIVAQFNSYSAPAVIMLTVMLSLIGVLLGLVISRQDFVIIMTMIGIISLAGVVVNNAIVLIDFTNSLRMKKREELKLGEFDHLPKEDVVAAIIEAGKTRLRPVLLTAITTILGLIPLAIGFNIDFGSFLSTYNPKIYFGGDNNAFFAPMSWTIIFGLTFATFLTLVIIPSLYLITHNMKVNLYRRLKVKYRSNI